MFFVPKVGLDVEFLKLQKGTCCTEIRLFDVLHIKSMLAPWL